MFSKESNSTRANPNTFPKKTDKKYADVLGEDAPIAGQKFVCVSFVSPENIIRSKQLFYFERFLKSWDHSKSMEKFVQFVNFLSFKYSFDFEEATNDLKEFVEEEKGKLTESTLASDYKTFVENNEDEMDKIYLKENDFQTNVRGIKIRGSYASQEEAELRCKWLREKDGEYGNDIFVGPVGIWMPWEPTAYKTGKVEYMEEELNKLMQEKLKNDKNAKENFEERVKETKRKAIAENIEKAKKSGNMLTQNIDEQGNLVGVNTMETLEQTIVKAKEYEKKGSLEDGKLMVPYDDEGVAEKDAEKDADTEDKKNLLFI